MNTRPSIVGTGFAGAVRCAGAARWRALATATLAMATLASQPARGEPDTFPNRTVRLVAAQQAGSATDHVARMLADALSSAWGQPTVVENRPGASGAIGTQAVARATPDGYTLLVGGMSNIVTSPLLDAGYGVDPESGLVAIGRVAWVPFVLAVHPDVPAVTLAELVAHVRARPGELVFATAGPTAYSRLCVDMLVRAHGLDLLTVEYRSAPAPTLDLVAGRAQLQVNELATMKQHADAGRLRILAVAGNRRAARIPAVPTFGEAGPVDIPVTPWYGLFAPAGTAPEVIARIEVAYRTAMRDPKVIARIDALGYEPILDEPGQFPEALRRDLAEARAMARRAGHSPAR